MRILLVDPRPDSRSAIVRWLDEFVGHVEIESVASGAEALRAMEKSAPDLVLAAHPMPAPGGVELAAIVKARLLDFLQRRFPAIWARSVSARALSALCARSGV